MTNDQAKAIEGLKNAAAKARRAGLTDGQIIEAVEANLVDLPPAGERTLVALGQPPKGNLLAGFKSRKVNL